MSILEFVEQAFYTSGVVSRDFETIRKSQLEEGLQWLMNRWKYIHGIYHFIDLDKDVKEKMFDELVSHICYWYKVDRPTVKDK
jgi:hypothetical protein